MKFLHLGTGLLFAALAAIAHAAPPPGWTAQNVGAPPSAGVVNFTEVTGEIAVSGPGHDLDGTTDNFQFIHQPLVGDGEVVVRVAGFTNVASYPHAGLMLRASLEANSAHVELYASPQNGVTFRSRIATGATTNNDSGRSASAPVWLKLARLGARVTAFTSADGIVWTVLDSESAMPLGETVYVGLSCASTTSGGGGVSTFDRLTLRQTGATPGEATASLIGSANVVGSVSAVAAESGAYVLSSNGGNIGGATPGLLFFQVPFSGDGEIRARIAGLSALGANSNVGLMIRDSLAPDSLYASVALSTTGVKRQHITTVGGNHTSVSAPASAAGTWLKLARHGAVFTASSSADGIAWQPLGKPFGIGIKSDALFGITLVGGGSGGSFAQAIVDQVAWPQAAPPAPPLDPVVAAGLAAWRKPDGNGVSCADCHTPFAYDIALFNFTRADVRLATTPHLPQSDADAIFDMVELLRAQYPPAGGLKDFRTFRPLQPGGGHIVGGENASANERDAAFGFYLRDHFKIGQDRIVTLAQARAAAQELIDVKTASVPVGIKFNKWSRSVLREGAVAGGEIAEWLPAAGVQPKPEFAAHWFALQDAYLRDPSNENFWAIYHASKYWTQLDPHNFTATTHGNWRWIIQNQFRSNALFTHDELLKARGLPTQLDAEDGVRPFPAQRDISGVELSPFWVVGDNARVVQSTGYDGMPRRNQESVHYDTSVQSSRNAASSWQVDDFRLTWFWIGWNFDNSLRFSGEGSTLSGEYFIGSLWQGNIDNIRTGDSDSSHGYRMHQVFFNAVQHLKLGFKPGAWRDNDGAQHFEASKGYYLGYDRWRTRSPYSMTDIGLPGANAQYKRLLSNHLRTALLIHADEAAKRGGVYFNENFTLADLTLWRDALHWADPEWTQADEALLADVKASINAPLSAAETSDPDGDGQMTVVEDALGTPPEAGNPAEVGSLVERTPEGLLAITFTRARADFTYIVEASSDLAEWSVIATNPGAVGEPVTVTDPSSGAQPVRFLRLRIVTTKV